MRMEEKVKCEFQRAIWTSIYKPNCQNKKLTLIRATKENARYE